MANKRKCKWCGEYVREFVLVPSGAFCNYNHAIEFARDKKQQQKVLAAQRRKKRKELNERRKALRPRSWYVKAAQRAFNAYIRERDKDQPCISCGRSDLSGSVGGTWDCGHFRSVGSAPELRFQMLNAHRQCKSCNSGSGKFGKFHKKELTISQEYEENLRKRVGDEAVDWLKGPHKTKNYSIQDLEAIKEIFNKLKLNLTKRGR